MSRALSRQLHLVDFALTSLWRRKVKAVSLLAVYTLIIFVIASLIFFVQSLKREAALLLQNAPDLVVQRTMAGRHDLIPDRYATEIATIRGVTKVTPRRWGYFYDPVFGANYTLLVPEDPPLAPGNVTIGRGVAGSQRMQAGDLLTFRTASNQPLLVTVQRILPAEAELVAADLVMMAPEDFQAMFNFPAGQATDLAVTVGNPRELPTIAAKIAARFPDTRPILKSEILRTYASVFDWRGGLMVVILAMAGLAFFIFAWDKATGLSAEERREIGILKSIGWETGDVLLLKFWEGVAISLTAYLGGVLLAYAHVYFFDAGLLEPALKGWSVLYPRFRLVPVLDAYQLGVLFFLTVLPYTAATIIPSWLAATIDPDAAMRSIP